MKKKVIASTLVLFLWLAGFSSSWIISEANLEIRFNDQTTMLSVRDKRCTKGCEQSAYQQPLNVTKTVQRGNSLYGTISGKYFPEVFFTFMDASALKVSLKADEKMPFDNFAFPYAFKNPSKNHYAILTDCEGLLLPVDDKEYRLCGERIFFCGGCTVMDGMGLSDTYSNQGI